MPDKPTTWVLAGATATGKTAVAQVLAEQFGCTILSSDAMLVYRGMDIGTAKPTPLERGRVPYFGIDLVSPSEPFSTGLWLNSARSSFRAATTGPNAFCGISADTPFPQGGLIVVGGTGLYIKALISGFDSEEADPALRAGWQALFAREGLTALRQALAARSPDALATLSDPANPRRLIRALEHLDARGSLPEQWKKQNSPSVPIAVLRLPREQLHARIEQRVVNMFRHGLVDEVRALRQTYPVWSATASQAIGYAETCGLLNGTLTVREATERIVIRTRQLAKRQETWFRHQTQAVWIDIDEKDPPALIAKRVLKIWRHYGPTPIQFS